MATIEHYDVDITQLRRASSIPEYVPVNELYGPSTQTIVIDYQTELPKPGIEAARVPAEQEGQTFLPLPSFTDGVSCEDLPWCGQKRQDKISTRVPTPTSSVFGKYPVDRFLPWFNLILLIRYCTICHTPQESDRGASSINYSAVGRAGSYTLMYERTDERRDRDHDDCRNFDGVTSSPMFDIMCLLFLFSTRSLLVSIVRVRSVTLMQKKTRRLC